MSASRLSCLLVLLLPVCTAAAAPPAPADKPDIGPREPAKLHGDLPELAERPDEVVHVNRRSFEIPMRIQPEQRAGVRELYLYLSRDRGKSWERYSKITPGGSGFSFSTNSDGLYYFTVAVVDQTGKQEPGDVSRHPVSQKIYIDTTTPVVKIVSAERSGDDVQVSWEAHDDHPEWKSLTLEYRKVDAPAGQWKAVPIEAGERGSVRFRPEHLGPIVLRLSLRDRAGNSSADERDLRTPRPPSELLPPLQLVNKRKARIEFEVPRAGPSGLGSVDVYVTTDDGATWLKLATSPNAPPAGNEPQPQGPVNGTVTVNLPRDGVVYGFYLVVKSRAGLGKQPPRPGDIPQVRIETDTVPPTAELYAPTTDPENRDRLLLRWKAEDRNLAPNPISLEWSATLNGPWTFIGDPQLPNNGRFSWQVPDNIPPRAYLRLSVRDRAGNNAVAQTPQPIYIDLVVPEAPIIKATSGQP